MAMELCGNVFVSKDMQIFNVKCLFCECDEEIKLMEFAQHIISHKKFEIYEPLIDEDQVMIRSNDDAGIEASNHGLIDEKPTAVSLDEFQMHDAEEEDDSSNIRLKSEDEISSEDESSMSEFLDHDDSSSSSSSDFEMDETKKKKRSTARNKDAKDDTSKFIPSFFRRDPCTLAFIEIYKQQKCLWDKKHNGYNNPTERKDSYKIMIEEIEKRFNVSLDEITLKSLISKIRKQYYAMGLKLESKKAKQYPQCAMEHYKKCKFLGKIEKTPEDPDNVDQNELQGITHKNRYLIFAKLQHLTEVFINVYKRHPMLYDRNHSDFSKNSIRRESYKTMSEVLKKEENLDISPERIYRYILSLRSWHNSICDRLNNSETLTANEQKYFEKCEFLPKRQKFKNLVCEICDKVSKTDITLQAHMFEAHAIGEMPIKCPECDLGFKQNSKLTIHMQRCHKTSEFLCEYCQKKFSVVADYRLHVRTHTDEKPYVCELCGKAFRLRTQLGYHVTAIHTKIRAFKCTMCPKDFLKQNLLNDHIKAHLNIRDKICQICGKGFTNCHSLIRHRQIHSEVKKFACKMCDARFHQFVGLNSHMKRTHNIVRSQKARTAQAT